MNGEGVDLMTGEVMGRFSGGREEGVAARFRELDLTSGGAKDGELGSGGDVGPVVERETETEDWVDWLLGKTEVGGERIAGLESKLIIPPPAVVVLALPAPLLTPDGPGELENVLKGCSG